jgi:hypothetical protein
MSENTIQTEAVEMEPTETAFLHTHDGQNYFTFVCEGCGSYGELAVPEEVNRFACPEGCGAVYIVWMNPLPSLMCVVKPIFADDDEDQEPADDCAYCGEWEPCSCYDD